MAEIKSHCIITCPAPQVDIELGSEKVEPGQEVDIRIRTRPDSYVCVLGIDQAVTVLK